MKQLLTCLPDILRICIIPLLGALVTYLCALIKRKAEQVRQTTNDEIVKKYLGMLESTVTNAVLCTKQTYVDALKEKGEFTEEAQKEADDIVKEAENRIISMIDEHEITRKAYEQKAEIIDSANAFSKDLINGTKKYADEILAELEQNLQEKIDVIKENRSELK